MLSCQKEVVCCSYDTTARFLTDVVVPRRSCVLQLKYNGAILNRCCRATEKICAAVMIQRRDSQQMLSCHEEDLCWRYDTTARFLTSVVLPSIKCVLNAWYIRAVFSMLCRATKTMRAEDVLHQRDSQQLLSRREEFCAEGVIWWRDAYQMLSPDDRHACWGRTTQVHVLTCVAVRRPLFALQAYHEETILPNTETYYDRLITSCYRFNEIVSMGAQRRSKLCVCVTSTSLDDIVSASTCW